MAARDKYHNSVRKALEKEGWTITHDPYRIEPGDQVIKIDLAAEKLLAAEKGKEKIAVEIKSFLNISGITDFYEAVGQFSYYSVAIEKVEPERELFLSIPLRAYKTTFKKPLVMETAEKLGVKIIVINNNDEKIVEWKK